MWIFISILIILGLIILLLIYKNKTLKYIQQTKEQYKLHLIETAESEAQSAILQIEHDAELKKKQIEREIEQEEEKYRLIQDNYKKIQNEAETYHNNLQIFYQNQIKNEKEIALKEIEHFKELQMQSARTAVSAEEVASRAQETTKTAAIITSLAEEVEIVAKQKIEINNELDILKEQLDDWKKLMDTINQDTLRRRELEEKQDFYRVCLTQEAIEDIKLLQEIRQRLHKSDNLNKLIYDVYVSKAVLEMTKRVLSGEAPSGIYKITRIKTGEIYIGKSTDVKSRWQQHCRTVYGAGTIAHSILHTTMERDGLENFTFELIEKVPKDKLSEREKYWITFYGSRDYGLNERCG